jgi:hypothetical protein
MLARKEEGDRLDTFLMPRPPHRTGRAAWLQASCVSWILMISPRIDFRSISNKLASGEKQQGAVRRRNWSRGTPRLDFRR